MSTNASAFLAILLVCSVGIPPAAAEEAPDEVLVQQGIAFRRANNAAEALKAFRKAHALNPTPRTRAHQGLAEQALGDWVAAERDLLLALDAPEDPWIVRHRSELDESLAFVRSRLGSIEVIGNVAGAELLIDGAAAGTLPMAKPLRAVAGTISVEVRATGYVPVRRQIVLLEAGEAREVFALVPAAAPLGATEETPGRPAGAPPKSDASDAPASTAGAGATAKAIALAVTGLGVAGLASGTYFGVRTFELKAERDGRCSASQCDGPGLELDAQTRDASLASTVSFGAGIVATGVGAWLLVRAYRNPPAPARPAMFLPAAAPRAAGVMVHVTW